MADTADIPLSGARLVAFRTLDIGEEVDLDAASRLLPGDNASRAAFRTVKPAHIQIADPPLVLRAGTVPLDLPGDARQATCIIKVYATGIMSVAFSLPLLDGTPLSTIPALADALTQSPQVDAHAMRESARLLSTLHAACRDPRPVPMVGEDYVVLTIRALGDARTPADLRAHPAVAALVLGEPSVEPALSTQVRDEALRGAVSYYADDLTVVDWNAALVLDPRADGDDVVDVLEFATQQLVGFRYYDTLVEQRLVRVHDELERAANRARYALLGHPWSALATELARLRVDITDITEKIDNAIKLAGDPSLARTYQLAVEKLRLRQWRVSVEEKLHLVDNLVGLVRGEATASKGHMLEWLVVVLILVEVVLGLVRH